MVSDFVNLKTLDRPTQIGRLAQALGFAGIVGPIVNAVARAAIAVAEPAPLIGSLPSFSPLVVGFHHHLLILPFNVFLGACLMYIGTGFLANRPWALGAMRKACWAGVGLSLLAAFLFALSILGPVHPVARLISLACVGVAIAWVVILVRVARELAGPTFEAHFGTATS
jgi:hypothetical protein